MKKKVIFVFFILFILFQTNNCEAKYVIEYTNVVANIIIDRISPQIEMCRIINMDTKKDNSKTDNYQIKIEIKIIEQNLKEDNFNTGNVKILVNEKEIKINEYIIELLENIGSERIYAIYISGIEEEGKLQLKVPRGVVTDIANNVNEEVMIDTKIQI